MFDPVSLALSFLGAAAPPGAGGLGAPRGGAPPRRRETPSEKQPAAAAAAPAPAAAAAAPAPAPAPASASSRVLVVGGVGVALGGVLLGYLVGRR